MITADWLSPEQQAVVVMPVTPWTWDEFYQAQRRIQDMLSTLDHKADIVIDFSRSDRLPANALSHLRTLRQRTHPNRGLVILVGLNPYLQSVLNILVQLNPATSKRIRLVGAMPQALEIAAESRRKRTT
jgi:anti-anti-sigma regulatory factor